MRDIRDTLLDRLLTVGTLTCQAPDYKAPEAQEHVKRLLMIVWRMMHPQNRERFIAALDENLNIAAKPQISEAQRAEMEMIEIIKGWPSVLSTVSGDDKGFALSIMKSRGNSEWYPSDAQAVRMRAIWAERSVSGDDIEVME